MDEVRGRKVAHGRGPVLNSVDRELFGWLAIVALTLGVMSGATHDAYRAGDHGWMLLLGGIELAGLIAYFEAAFWWVNFRKD